MTATGSNDQPAESPHPSEPPGGWSLKSSTLVICARGLRGFGDGFVVLLLPIYLSRLGFSPFRIGMVMTATLLGSSALTLSVGLVAHRFETRRLLLAASVLMLATGLAFAQLRQFWPLMVVGFVGTLNPSAGDSSVFLPLEQSLLAHAGAAEQRTALFARYFLAGSLMAALGALAISGADRFARHYDVGFDQIIRVMFALYGALGVAAFALYSRLPPAHVDATVRRPLGPSRRTIFTLAGLFSIDSLGSGIAVQSLIALWLFHHFGLSIAAAGVFFFWTGLFSSFPQLAAPALARRLGLIRMIAVTHIPSNLCMMLVPFMPNLGAAMTLLLIRATVSNLDAPARTSYLMAVVSPAERAAAASIVSVLRSLATAVGPTLAGLMLTGSGFGWPLLIGGGLKATYDVLLLAMFGRRPPPEERP